MCGIIGVFGKDNAVKLVSDGLSLMSYRGEDGNGIAEIKSENGILVFGHCLHSIIGNISQPIKDNGVFVSNCEIYNWKKLALKYSIKCDNDAELLFKILEKSNNEKFIVNCLSELDGDYACAYYINNKIYLFRDVFGVKPLWYGLEDGFAFSSEKKVLENIGYNNVEDLNPRKVLVYDLNNKSVSFLNRNFFDLTPVISDDYGYIKKKTGGLLINAIAKRIPDCKFGLMFSGGVDSAFIALILKNLGVDFECYVAVVDEPGLKEAEDLDFSIRLAKIIDLKLNVIKISLNEVEAVLKDIPRIIESSNVTKVGVALPFYFCAKKAHTDGCKVLFSGLGSEEIFAGYERHLRSTDVNKECFSGLLWIYERDLYRDDSLTMFNNIELRVPFLDNDLTAYSLRIPSKFKIDKHTKQILRDIAFDFGLPKEFSYRKKRAAQYGSNFDKAIDKLFKKSKFSKKSEYLFSFYPKPNLKLGVLFSSGKDSCYAMYIMKMKNYSIECLISLKPDNPDSFMFQNPNINILKLQSEALGIPLITLNTKGREEMELDDLKKILVLAKDKYKLNGIVTGALFSTYQRDRIEKVCEDLGLKVFSPLWHKTQEDELRELIYNDFEVIIIKIASDGLDKSWIGKKLDEESIDKLVVLCKKFGLNPAFEGGEAETIVLDCPMFDKKIKIISAEKIMSSENCGDYIIKDIELVDKCHK